MLDSEIALIIFISIFLFLCLMFIAYRKIKLHFKTGAYEKENTISSVNIETNSRAKVYLHRAAKSADIPSLPVARFDLLLPPSSNTYREDIESKAVEINLKEKPFYFTSSSSKTGTPAITPPTKQMSSTNVSATNTSYRGGNSSNMMKSISFNRCQSGLFQQASQIPQQKESMEVQEVTTSSDSNINMSESDNEESALTVNSNPSEYLLEKRQASYKMEKVS